MPFPLSDMDGEVLSGFPGDITYIVIVGGCSAPVQLCDPINGCNCPQITANVTAYHPNTDTWTFLAPAPIPRYRHSVAVIGNKLYVIGGRTLDDVIIARVDVYDPANNSWSTESDWPFATSDFSLVVIHDNILIFGGYDQDYTSQKSVSVRLANGTWVNNQVADMFESRGDSCAVENPQGEVWVFGGFDSHSIGGFCTPLNELERYNVTSNSWAIERNLTAAAGDRSCALLHGLVHAFGGEQKDANCSYISTPTASVEVYDPSANTWTVEASLLYRRFRFTAVTWQTPDPNVQLVFLFGGQGSYNQTLSGFPLLSFVTAFSDPVFTATTNALGSTSAGPLPNAAHALSASVFALVALFLIAVNA